MLAVTLTGDSQACHLLTDVSWKKDMKNIWLAVVLTGDSQA